MEAGFREVTLHDNRRMVSRIAAFVIWAAVAASLVFWALRLGSLRAALGSARAGITILLKPNNYSGSLAVSGIEGTADQPIIVAAADPDRPPVILGGPDGLKFVRPRYLELRDLVFEGQSGNGLNIDDGDTPDDPAFHITLDRITVRGIRAAANTDGIKLSGVSLFFITNCRIQAWGDQASTWWAAATA